MPFSFNGLFSKALVVISVMMLTSACEKSLNVDGGSSYLLQNLYMQQDSTVRVFSYLDGSPEYLTDLNFNNGVVSVPNNILIPKMIYGVPENPLLYTDRSRASTPLPLDLFVKIYSPSSPTKDFYFEIPVHGAALTPSNVTTALSWILRWSFSEQKISISRNQFEELALKVEVACSRCRERSNSEVVELILSDSKLVADILAYAQKSNPTLNISNVSYTPPSLEYVWSDPVIRKGWNLVLSVNEPAINETARIVADALFVDPRRSSEKQKPASWAHQAELDEVPGQTSIMGDIDGTPLVYDLDSLSSGLHLFTARFNGSSQPLFVRASVIDTNMTPMCVIGNSLHVRANKRTSASLDYTITPTVVDTNGARTSRLTSSEVVIRNVGMIPPAAQGIYYSLVFKVSPPPGQTVIDIYRLPLGSSIPTLVVNSRPYSNGQPISFENMTLFVSGLPANDDKVVFSVPDANPAKNFIANLGCIDPDPSPLSSLIFRKVSGPDGLTVSSNGNLSWIPSSADYHATLPTRVVFSVEDSTGVSQNFEMSIFVSEDLLPRFCLPSQVDGVSSQCAADLPALLEKSPGLGFPENIPVNQEFMASDRDGDPLRVVVRSIIKDGMGDTALVTTNANATNLLRLSSNWVSTLPSNSNFHYSWQFTPHITQGTNGPVRVRFLFDVFYTDPEGKGEINTSQAIRTFETVMLIEDTLNIPTAFYSEVATCGTSACSPSNQAHYKPIYQVVAGGRDPSPVGGNTNLTDPRTEENILKGGFPVTNPLQEGKAATIRLPLVARISSDRLSPSVLYQITRSGSTPGCAFLDPGRVRITPDFCAGTTSGTHDCLRLDLNYDSASGVHLPLPMNTPQSCRFSIVAYNGLDTDHGQGLQLTEHEIHIQDVNQAPFIPTAISSPNPVLKFEDLPPDPLNPTQGLPNYFVERKRYDLGPYLKKIYADQDMGPYSLTALPEDNLVTLNANSPIAGAGDIDLFTLPVQAISPELKLSLSSSGHSGSFLFQVSTNGGATWATTALPYWYTANNSTILEFTPSNDFNGSYRFETCTAPALDPYICLEPTATWNQLPADSVIDLDANAALAASAVVSLTPGATKKRYLLQRIVRGRYYRAVLVTRTAGSVTGNVISSLGNSTSVADAAGENILLTAIGDKSSSRSITIQTSTDFEGSITVQSCNSLESGCPYSDISVMSEADGSMQTSLYSGTFTLLNIDSSRRYRVLVTGFTAGTVSTTVMGGSSNVLTAKPTEPDQNWVFLDTVGSNYSSSILRQAGRVWHSGTMNLGASYVFDVSGLASNALLKVVFRNTRVSLAVGGSLPSASIGWTQNKDPREVIWAWKCWIKISGVFTECADRDSAVAYDTEKNPLFLPPFPLDMTAPVVQWTPPYSIAVDGNLAASGQRTPSFEILLRAIDKGFYNPMASILPTTSCGSGSPAYSCADYTFPVTVIENPAPPDVRILDATKTQYANAFWRTGSTQKTSAPIIEVTEGTTREFTLRVDPYSLNIADQVSFRVKQRSCVVNGKTCTKRPDGTFLIHEPSNMRGNFSTITGTKTLDFTLKAQPNFSDGNGASYANSLLYAYAYDIGEVDGAGNFITDKVVTVTFSIRVSNQNRMPTDIIFASTAMTHSGYSICTNGDPICATTGSSFRVNIDRTMSPSTSAFAIPLRLVDEDQNADGSDGDDLTISFAGSVNSKSQVSLVKKVISGKIHHLVLIQLNSSLCAKGNTSSTLQLNLSGSDKRTGSKTVSKTLSVEIAKVSATNCL